MDQGLPGGEGCTIRSHLRTKSALPTALRALCLRSATVTCDAPCRTDCPMTTLVPVSSLVLPSLVAAAGEWASVRLPEFFAAEIRNPHTRRAYVRAAGEFLTWCEAAGVLSLTRGAAVVCRGLDRGSHAQPHGANSQTVSGGGAPSLRPAGGGSGGDGEPCRLGVGPRHVVRVGMTP